MCSDVVWGHPDFASKVGALIRQIESKPRWSLVFLPKPHVGSSESVRGLGIRRGTGIFVGALW